VNEPFWNKLKKDSPNARFHYLQCIGVTRPRKPYPTDGLNYRVEYNDYFKEWDPNRTSKLFENATYHMVRATKESMDISINKMDTKAICPDPKTDEVFRITLSLVIKYLEYMRSTVDPKRQIEFNGAAAPGLGYSGTKADALKSERFKRNFPSLDKVPVDVLNDKNEELAKEDLDRKKVRTVFGSPVDFVAKEKIAYGGQNEKIKNNHRHSWIKYGCVKQYGGFDIIFKLIERFLLRAESDCSGWDRIIFLLFVYFVRHSLLDNYVDYRNLCDFVSFFNIHGVVILPDGTIWIRDTGCSSGKNNTTTDNSIGHLIIKFYMLLSRAKELGKPLKLSTILENAECAIYSDDKIISLDPEFWQWDVESYKAFEAKIYLKFGLTIKPSQQFVTMGVPGKPVDPGHSFLGSFAHFNDTYSMYIPYPRVGKVTSSLINKLPNLDDELIFRRFLVLATLIYPNRELFKEAISLIKFYMSKNPQNNATYQMILEEHSLDLDVETEFLRLYIGFEANPRHPPFNFFVEDGDSITHELWKFENSDVSAKNNYESNSDAGETHVKCGSPAPERP